MTPFKPVPFPSEQSVPSACSPVAPSGAAHPYAFPRSLRLKSRKTVDVLFTRRDITLTAYPLRAVACRTDDSPVLQVMFCCSKRRLHDAVPRNRARRQMREAFRLNRHALSRALSERGVALRVAFLWMSSRPVPTPRVESAMKTLLLKLALS